jgi:hypothetical protein
MDLLVTVSWAMANDYVILVMPPMLWPPHDHLWARGSLHCSVFVLFSFVSISLFLRFCWLSWMMSCELKLCPYFHLMHCNWSFNSLVQVMLSLRVQLFPRLDIVDWILLRVQFMRRTVNLALPLWAQHPWLLLLQPAQDVWNPALQVKIYISHKLLLYVWTHLFISWLGHELFSKMLPSRLTCNSSEQKVI